MDNSTIFTPVRGYDRDIQAMDYQDGFLYFAIDTKKIYLDVTNNSNLMNKPNLQKLLANEENLDIITFSTSDIYRYATDDYYDIKRFLRESNLGIYDLNYESFSIERQPLLYWLGY